MRLGIVGPSYTSRSTAVSDEEAINLYAESVMSQGSIVPNAAYGGKNAIALKSFFRTPGLSVFCTLPMSPVRGLLWTGLRLFVVAGTNLYEVLATGVFNQLGNVDNDGNPASMAFNGIQFLVVSAGRAFCYTLATGILLEVTVQLAGPPLKCDYADSFFVVTFEGSNKFQISQVLDGTNWPGLLVNEISVFAENIISIIFNHRELWVFGSARSQPYQNTGSAEVYDVIPGALIEKGCISPFCPCLVDNSVFWIDQDARGGRGCWRSNGYTPTRISSYAVEYDLSTYTAGQASQIVTYSYQDGGHLFWVIYVPGAQWSWVYDVGEGLWHKRAEWNAAKAVWSAHYSWNHVPAFGLHLVGDWNSGNLYSLSMNNLTDNGVNVRWLRRSPHVINEMEWVSHDEITLDFETGVGPQPPLLDGNGNPRAPMVMLRWSDDRGKTWSNEHQLGMGMAGRYKDRVRISRLGISRYRVYEVSGTDPVTTVLVDAYLETS